VTPQPGDFGVMATGGWGARLIQVVTHSPVNHAILYLGNGWCIEGRPEGAGPVRVDAYAGTYWSHMDLTDEQRESIVAHGRSHLGAPYSWLDDLAIGLAHIFGRALPQFIRRRLSSRDRLMCSQLVDLSYLEAGVHLFDDGRLPGDVAPGDLYDLINPTK